MQSQSLEMPFCSKAMPESRDSFAARNVCSSDISPAESAGCGYLPLRAARLQGRKTTVTDRLPEKEPRSAAKSRSNPRVSPPQGQRPRRGDTERQGLLARPVRY